MSKFVLSALLLACLVPCIIAGGCSGTSIGPLPTLFHGVSGNLYVVDERSFCIEEFYYDGQGPDAFLYFYYPGDEISDMGGGVYIPINERAQFEVGRGYTNETLTIGISNKYKACDFEGFGIWCRYANQLFTSITWSNADIFGDGVGQIQCNPSPGAYAGFISTFDHGVSGKFYIRDEKTFVIRDFTYDGQGPDAFVYWYPVGAVVDPLGGGQIIPLPAPEGIPAEEGRFSSIAYTRTPPQEDFVITIPDNLDVFTCDIGNFTIWCRELNIFFTVLTLNGKLFTNNPLERDYQPDKILCDRPATRPGVLVGELSTTDTRAISGTFYVQDQYTFYIQLFSYDASRPETYLYYYAPGVMPDMTSGEGGSRIPFSAESGPLPMGRSSSFFNGNLTVDLSRVMTGPAKACDIGYLTIFDESANEQVTKILIPDDIFVATPEEWVQGKIVCVRTPANTTTANTTTTVAPTSGALPSSSGVGMLGAMTLFSMTLLVSV